MATAQWENLDARKAIHGTVDEINRIGDGFKFSQDFLLKAGLMLAGVGSVRFKVTNFNRENMTLLEDRWDPITRAVHVAVELVARFGFSRGSLSASNAVLPSLTTCIVEAFPPDSCLRPRTVRIAPRSVAG